MIALQINTWNQNRLNGQEEQRILASVSKELQLNKFLFHNGSQRQKNRVQAALNLLEEIHSPQNINDNLDTDLKTLTSRWLSGTPTSIYDALIGSGDMKYVSSEELRNAIAALKSDQEFLSLFENIQVRFVDDRLNPFLNQYVNRADIQSKGSINRIFNGIPTLKFETSYAGMIKDNEFANLLVEFLEHTVRINENYLRLENSVQMIDSLIKLDYNTVDTSRIN